MNYLIVDAFAEAAFSGNPAAVVFVDRPSSESEMQAIAAEFNLAETAFLAQRGPGHWHLRWFTPRVEIDLCGHATLAAAHAIWECQRDIAEQLRFDTLSGELHAKRDGGRIALRFPTIGVKPASVDAQPLNRLRLSPVAMAQTPHDLLLELKDAAAVESFVADYTTIAELPWRGLIITARQHATVDFVSRFFAPKLGIPEDPVTGAVHCALAPYWAKKLNKDVLVAQQLSARGGLLHLTTQPDHVVLAGSAVSVMEGQLRL